MYIDLMEVYNKLYSEYNIPEGWWPGDNEFEIMIGALLTQNTNWNNVEKSLDNIKKRNLMNPESLYYLPINELEELIRPSGFYTVKAKYIKNLLEWFKTYNFSFEVINKKEKEILRNELLNIKGIGKETADSILLYAFNKLSFVIDAYTKRMFSRLGLNIKVDYDTYKNFFENNLPKDIMLYKNYHGLIVEHSKNICKKKPLCENCKLKFLCKTYKTNFN
ncbi:endonuclease III domain-containing protein [Marinitoga aeolica]|uniref:Endonuclease III domain-containing protein n=1 Tax=Marinitoga aeolica TaxID=2809031 RepID=A0ABY8PQN0_9BACT|nr:endonuclease III domain-containing protein [Marinitoga aeolica]WGS64956.1 endonuclease III domain-containing protein [Marinitoga aeolica]